MAAKVSLPVLYGKTQRTDNWWVAPALTALVILSFIAYATFRVFENANYEWGPYLSPFYSPFIATKGLPFLTPAMLILPGPLSFRLTCYYYRKAYYRALVMTPPACGVRGNATGTYAGERRILIFQNLHRFALYVAVIFLVFLWWDAFKSLHFSNGWGLGVGSIVMFTNVTLLTLYTFSCHSMRHLIGGGLDSFSSAFMGSLRHTLWSKVTILNDRHMLFAWLSLFGVGLTDAYIRAVASSAIADIRLF